jgi:hypothetical protein
MSYQDRVSEAGPLGEEADALLRHFATTQGLKIEETPASLKVRGPDRRAVVLQPAPAGGGDPGLRVQFHEFSKEEAAPVQEAILSVGGRPEQTFSFIPLRVVVERWQDVERECLRAFFGVAGAQDPPPNLQLGERVRLRLDVNHYPAPVIPAGTQGVIVDVGADGAAVMLDDPVDGLEDWDNELRWDSIEEALGDLEVAQGRRRYFTAYWTNEPWLPHENQPLEHTAGGEFFDKGVTVGDVIYIVHYESREVFLGGRIRVGALLTQQEADEHFGHEVWPASDHLLAQLGTEEFFKTDRVVPREVLHELKFVSGSGRDVLTGIKVDSDGAANQQTLRAVRELSPDSAAILDRLLDNPAETEASIGTRQTHEKGVLRVIDELGRRNVQAVSTNRGRSGTFVQTSTGHTLKIRAKRGRGRWVLGREGRRPAADFVVLVSLGKDGSDDDDFFVVPLGALYDWAESRHRTYWEARHDMTGESDLMQVRDSAADVRQFLDPFLDAWQFLEES